MNDEHKQYASTAAATLEAHILSVHSAKSEAEWWAQREIERLRAENEELKQVIENGARLMLRVRMKGEKLRAALKDLIEDHEYMTDTDAEEDNMARAAARAALKETGDD